MIKKSQHFKLESCESLKPGIGLPCLHLPIPLEAGPRAMENVVANWAIGRAAPGNSHVELGAGAEESWRYRAFDGEFLGQ